MPDLNITIIEEHTKRVSKNFALTHTRRRTITIEDPEPKAPTQSPKSTSTTVVKSCKSGDNTITTTTTTTTIAKRSKELTPVCSTTTIARIPYSHYKVWTEQDKDQNFLVHIKAHRDKKALHAQKSI